MPLRFGAVRPSLPRGRRTQSVTAAASVLGTRKTLGRSGVPVWQQQAWDFFDQIGEVRYAARYYGNSLSRLRLFVGWRESPSQPVVPIDPTEMPPGVNRTAYDVAERTVARLHSTDGSVAELLRAFGVNLFVAGEGYIVGRTEQESGREVWDFLSVDQVVFHNGGWYVRESVADKPSDYQPLNEDEDVVRRVWLPHPRFAQEADSPMRAVLTVCEELLLLSASVRAAALSRISSGILLMPDTMLEGGPDTYIEGDGTDGEAQADRTLSDIVEHFVRPIADPDSAAAVAPFILTGDPEDIDRVRLLEPSRTVDEVAANQRQELLVRLANGVDLPPEVLTGMGESNHWCVDDRTEILTADRGWITETDLHVGDVVLTLNHETGLSQWQPVLDVYRADVTDEPMVLFEGRNHCSLTTLNHRWPVIRERQKDGQRYQERRFEVTENLRIADRIPTAAPCVDLPDAAKYSDAFVELVGWFWTEGSVSSSGKAVSIAQSHTVNPERVARIRAALTSLFGPASDALRGMNRPAWRESWQANWSSYGGPVTIFHLNIAASEGLLSVAPGRVVTPSFVLALTRAQLELFVDVSGMGDGQHYRRGASDMWQKNPAQLDAYELALILLGRMIARAPSHDDGWRIGVWKQTDIRPVKAAIEQERTGSGGLTRTEIAYTGRVWCPVTENGTWFARREGRTFYTGNSAWLVDEQTFRTHIAPAAQLFVNAVTEQLVWPSLQAAGIPVDERLVVGFDPSDLVGHPDRKENAKDGHSALVISDEAYRRALGFAEDDAPDGDEVARRVALRLNNVELYPIAAGRPVSPSNLLEPVSVPTPTPVALPPANGPTDASPDEPGAVTTGPPARPGLTASAAEDAIEFGVLLGKLDRALFDRMETACTAAMDRALERAGARLRSRLARIEGVKEMVAGAPAREVGTLVGRDVVAAAGIADEDLVDDAEFEELAALLLLLSGRAHDRVRARLRSEFGLSEVELEAMAERQAQDRNIAATFLVSAMVGLAAGALFGGKPSAPTLGEFDPSSRVPSGVVRSALAVAGGGPPTVNVSATGTVTVVAPLPVGAPSADGIVPTNAPGLAVEGPTTREFAGQVGLVETGFLWDYGDEMRQTFEPHFELDGQEFAGPEDSALSNPDDFPAAAFYAPGDHDGCRCTTIPVYTAIAVEVE